MTILIYFVIIEYNLVNDCKKRWRNIRDTYMKSKKKLGTGSQSSLKKPWPLAQNVAFLDKVEFERRWVHYILIILKS